MLALFGVTCTGLQSRRLADIQYMFNKARYTERGPQRQLLQMLSHPGRWSQVGSELCGANKLKNLLPSSDVSAGRRVRKKIIFLLVQCLNSPKQELFI